MRRVWHCLRRLPAPLRIGGLLVGVIGVAAPLAIPVYRWEDSATNGQSVILTPVIVFGVLVLGLPLWLRHVHRCPRPWVALGMTGWSRWWRSWGIAFVAGAAGVGLLYGLQGWWGWGLWEFPTVDRLIPHALEGFLVGLGVGLAEELLFRGWVLFEFEQDYAPGVALWLSTGLFAIAHYLRPLEAILDTWPQFLGLGLLGLTLGWARRIPCSTQGGGPPQTTLGFAAGLHGGLVWAYYQVDVGDLMVTTGRVPDWVTGIGGNPLAGGLGLLLLGAIARATYQASRRAIADS